MALNNPHRTAAGRTHTSLHRLAGTRVRIAVVNVALARDLDVLLGDHESVGGHAAGASLAVGAVADEAGDGGERGGYFDLLVGVGQLLMKGRGDGHLDG